MRRFAPLCILLFTSFSKAQTPVTITAHPESPGIAIPSDFIGLSFETGSLTGSSSAFPATNPIFQRMVAQIGPGLLRFGGNSVDKLTGWMRGARTSSTPTSIITSSDADAAFAFARAVGWHVLFSLNLGQGAPASDADEANYVYSTASDVVFGLEIGNEPDLYHSNGLRPSSYNFNDYIAEWHSFASAILTQEPYAILTGPAASGSITSWTSSFAQNLGSSFALLTQHLYPLAPISVNPNASNAASIPNLIGTAARTTEDTDGAELQQIAQGQKIAWRMAETNSCYSGGQAGVSDVFASALWGVDYMFTLANRAAAGVNFHGGGTGNYTPIAVSSTQATARPLYYALLMFRAAARGRIVPLNVSAFGINLTAYGALDTDGTLRVVAINKDLSQDAAVTITPGAGYTTALAMTLTAPDVSSTSGAALGGASVSVDGTWLPAQLTSLTASGGAVQTTVPHASAVLLSFSSGSVGVANAASGETTVAPNSLASAYGEALGMAAAQSPAGTVAPGLAGVNGTITDSSGATQPLALSYAGTSQVNFLVPAGTATGQATVRFGAMAGTVNVKAVSPGLFTLGPSRAAAATAVRIVSGETTQTPVAVFDCGSGACVATPIFLDSASTVYVSLYGTGLRGAGSAVACTVGSVPANVTFTGAQPSFPGLDQVNIAIPASLHGAGKVDVVVTAGGQPSNAVELAFQ
ncbi:MAG TPA: hypothetical protein VKB88_44310 [Bryobacteraceae bacterium]|nr:hypothetical protein [Bryobacteraceae bacterium]